MIEELSLVEVGSVGGEGCAAPEMFLFFAPFILGSTCTGLLGLCGMYCCSSSDQYAATGSYVIHDNTISPQIAMVVSAEDKYKRSKCTMIAGFATAAAFGALSYLCSCVVG